MVGDWMTMILNMMRLTQSLFFTADWITNMEWIIEQLVYSLIMFLYHFLPTFCPRGYLLPSVFGFIVYLPVNLIHRQVLLPSDLLRVFVVIDVLLNLSYKWQMHSVLANAFSVGKYSGPVVTNANSVTTPVSVVQEGIPPQMFKAVVADGHSEFSSTRQQIFCRCCRIFTSFFQQSEPRELWRLR
ncbi:transmembrane protein, putative [Medicago truncatula]|uniref:Transmembrane protein, putative n=1 Tax=Medicago truncatula TaxID=3880 RepID=G7JRQ1_MEDTR|nr:transmembrane protein, putative [Medicago truncatula]